MEKDLLTLRDLNKEEITALVQRGLELKAEGRNAPRSLAGYTLGLIFDKSSTRTRVSFETAMFRLGGQTLFLHRTDTQMARDEDTSDTARVLSRYLDVLAIRTFSQELVEELARWSDIPVINALTDLYHPCQVLSDIMTVWEKKGPLDRLKIAWIGDGNNMSHSWINAADIMGFELVLACPPGYYPKDEIINRAGSNIRLTSDPKTAAKDADIVNTDVWASMGQEDEHRQRVKDFSGFQVNKSLLELSKDDVLVMHCLPAHRGEEITAEVLEGPNSIVFDQAENKLYLHQAILEKLLARG